MAHKGKTQLTILGETRQSNQKDSYFGVLVPDLAAAIQGKFGEQEITTRDTRKCANDIFAQRCTLRQNLKLTHDCDLCLFLKSQRTNAIYTENIQKLFKTDKFISP